jgi:Radical SAM superfamily
MIKIDFKPSDLVKTCRKLERGLRFGPEGIRACQVGPYASPIYWSEEEASVTKITKDMIVEQRKRIFLMLNDKTSATACKQCAMVEEKPYREVEFTKLGHIDHAPRTICNLRCNYCGYTHAEERGDLKNAFVETGYNSLEIMSLFAKDDVSWDAFVDFNGGETSLIKNIDKYLEFFKEMKIRVLLYTNGVNFKQSIYDNLKDGSIEWVVTSVDCGTPATYKKTKKADAYGKVIENCTKYAHAAAQSSGNFAVKYIFTNDNCGDDDLWGFAYAMLAIRPQKIWLTFDFTPFGEIGGDTEDFGKYDFTSQINAYAKLYVLLTKHGLTPVHYAEGHLAAISKAGRRLLEQAKRAIRDRQLKHVVADQESKTLYLQDFRAKTEPIEQPLDQNRKIKEPKLGLTGIQSKDGVKPSELFKNKRVAIAPVTQDSKKFLGEIVVAAGDVVALLDKSKAINGKTIDGIHIYDYESLPALGPDVVVVIPPPQHRSAILNSIIKNTDSNTEVMVLTLSH